MVPAVELKTLTKRYQYFFKKKEILAVAGIDLEVSPGEVFGLLGPNGAGKTTTIKMICGLVRPTAGSVRIHGIEVERNRKQILKKIGAVLEGTRNFHWPLTPKENLRYFGNLKGIRTRYLKENIDKLLDLFGLQEKKDIPAKFLSQGMRQKLGIAIALISDPEVLLLDEPTQALDVGTSILIRERIKEMAVRDGKAVILTTHNMEVAQNTCHRIAIINKGKIAAVDKVENLINIFSKHIYEFKIEDHASHRELVDKIRTHPLIEEVTSEILNGCNTLTLQLKETAALYSIMDVLRDKQANIQSINKKEANLEEIFLELTGGEE